MDTSAGAIFLVIVAGVSTIYAFILEIRRTSENDRFLEWLKTERRTHWEGLTRLDRFLTVRAVEILRHGSLSDDAEFQARYLMTRHGKRFAIALIVSAAVFGILALGVVLLDWDF